MNFESIASTIINHSLTLKKGDNLYITVRGTSQIELAKAVENLAKTMGINTRYGFKTTDETKLFYENVEEEELNAFIMEESDRMRWADGIALISENVSTKLSPSARAKSNKVFLEVHEKIRLKKKWLLTGAPCMEECNNDKQIFNEMMDTYLKACSIDYTKMDVAQDTFKRYLEKSDKVRIVAKGTDITFSIKDMPAIKCVGTCNLPDGEIFTAPIKNSVNGIITYNLPSKRNGLTHNNICLEFHDGKIIKESSDHSEELTDAFNVDEGARYIGEFAFGVNPFVNKCFNNILYDEKISGSIHFTPGSCYDDCDNGNKSAMHWDLVQSHTPEFGGGEIYLDGVLIRKNGRFVLPELECLNPENLI